MGKGNLLLHRLTLPTPAPFSSLDFTLHVCIYVSFSLIRSLKKLANARERARALARLGNIKNLLFFMLCSSGIDCLSPAVNAGNSGRSRPGSSSKQKMVKEERRG